MELWEGGARRKTRGAHSDPAPLGQEADSSTRTLRCTGFGTRLRPLTLTLPKPLVEFVSTLVSRCFHPNRTADRLTPRCLFFPQANKVPPNYT